MLLRTNEKDKNGNVIYVNRFTGKRQILAVWGPLKNGRIPDGVFGRFIKPAPTTIERSLRF